MAISRLLLILLLLTACSETKQPLNASEVSARQTSAEGSALMAQGDKPQARREAIEAATQIAAEQLRGKNTGNSPLMTEIKVVDEWQEGNVYHVQILAQLSDKQVCESAYRKKIVATAFPVVNTDQISGSESQDLFGGIPREINNRLTESGDFIGRNLTNTVLYSKPDLAPDILPSTSYVGSSILNIARQQDAQFVLAGVIRDFKIESTQYVRGTGLFAEIKSLVRDMVSRRSIGIDIYVYDGFSGALVFQHRYTDSILGDVSLPAGYTVGSERFNDTPAGHSINTIIQQASDDIRRLFLCFPFASRVTQISQNHIIIAAGAQDKVKTGDQFKVYPASSTTSGFGTTFPASQGVLTITDVSSNAAMGTLDGGEILSVHPGDWVKSATLK
ncbi:flagella assembly protein FlgT middle domain-containing protein [Methylomonas sp. AM2-LC]|uniref:flagella assembly protein FlgT middle domain-containing protein n=1 Tax=Methylomonas sp. AM2-LC TaxID=3153301 RepID=UPI003262DFEC